jgi:hypothetical protein
MPRQQLGADLPAIPSRTPPTPLWDCRVDGWRVWVVRYGDTTPLVTATMVDPWLLRQVCMEAPSPRKIRDWVATLGGAVKAEAA